MKNILLIVDMQNGFARNKQTKDAAYHIQSLVHSKIFDYVVATRFENYDSSIYEKLFDWHDLKTEEDKKLSLGIEECADLIIDKSIYTCVNAHFMQRICQLNNGEYPDKIFICGVDTDCCVLKIATDLFEYNVRPIVLTDYCASNGGLDSHLAGIACMKRLIGPTQLYAGKIVDRESLANI